MPVCFGRDVSGNAGNCLDIGLVNNMPGKALQATERQFLTLLNSAARNVAVRLWLYALPDVPRTDSGRRHIDSFYSGIDQLWDRPLDGLIVTGMEPRASNLKDEPHWASMTRLIDWAERNTRSTIWSCLAAHAAVLHTDGIVRRRLSEKRFGLFECDRVSEHPVLAGVPSTLSVPHSRWNDLREQELSAAGYGVLTRGREAGVDMFIKQRQSLFIFLQGHPEYDANSLQLEYARDVGRYLRRETENYPPLPYAYFDRETEAALTAIEARAVRDPREELLADVTAHTTRNRTNVWHSPAIRIYSNWLAHLSAAQAQATGQLRRDLEHHSVAT
ncbi:MAG: homoserine O-succinyltransferase [Bryobacteraceae bacterium]|jgi:homoserine O-succinyltransferase